MSGEYWRPLSDPTLCVWYVSKSFATYVWKLSYKKEWSAKENPNKTRPGHCFNQLNRVSQENWEVRSDCADARNIILCINIVFAKGSFCRDAARIEYW